MADRLPPLERKLMSFVDHYAILGIDEKSTDAQIKKAFRRQSLLTHPDRNQGSKNAEERFRQVQSAYQVLSDPNRRRAFDAELMLQKLRGYKRSSQAATAAVDVSQRTGETSLNVAEARSPVYSGAKGGKVKSSQSKTAKQANAAPPYWPPTTVRDRTANRPSDSVSTESPSFAKMAREGTAHLSPGEQLGWTFLGALADSLFSDITGKK